MNRVAGNPAKPYVTMVEVLERIVPYEEFAAVVEDFARRLEADGVSALASVQFYADPESTEAGALLTFSDPDRFMEHIHRVVEWEEFERFVGAVRPLDIRVYGTLGAEAWGWLGQFNLVSKKFAEHLAGFVRGGNESAPPASEPA